ncbi:hypothetical protein ACEPAI_2985 [Sanghuangporus weigelae]
MPKSTVPSKTVRSTSIPTNTARELFGVTEKVQWEFENDKSNLNHNIGVFTAYGIHRKKLAFAPTDELEEVRYFHEHYLIGRDPSYRKERFVAKGAGAMVVLAPRQHTRGLRPVECLPYPLYTVHCHFNPDDYDLAEFGADHPNTQAARARRRYTVDVKDYVYADGKKVR